MVREGVTDGAATNTDAKVRKKWDEIEIRHSSRPLSTQRGEENEIGLF